MPCPNLKCMETAADSIQMIPKPKSLRLLVGVQRATAAGPVATATGSFPPHGLAWHGKWTDSATRRLTG